MPGTAKQDGMDSLVPGRPDQGELGLQQGQGTSLLSRRLWRTGRGGMQLRDAGLPHRPAGS